MASALTRHEGGQWHAFPECFGKISVRCFLDHVEFHDEGQYAGLAEFNYGGMSLYFHSVKFTVPFKGNDTSSPRDIFDARVWKMTNFQTPWRDELKAWEDA